MIKHRAVAIRGMLPDGSQEETFVRIGGKWYLFSWKYSSTGTTTKLPDRVFMKTLVEGQSGFSDNFMCTNFGVKHIKDLLKRKFILEWTSDVPVYGVPF